ncbi:hypothetical protein EMA8858_03832 [Emticicia aquatica]|uniref:Nucleotidyltransferase family protein n=1 Tax=Emticicia aquatica TaxID=1681835 RepID=A0ABN8F384_9BACT|nr:nucleotidyltransferase family protein [Emticicia aquatica]CAH0997698.1 hypothetical protein EMA8858_03832 [Emticicia aquatica]
MFSIELQLLIESIKVVLLDKPKEKLIELFNNPAINWARINHLLARHQIRPIVYEAARQSNFKNNFIEQMGHFSKVQSIKNLMDSHELTHILENFQQHNIEVLPYKGLVFLEKMYQNRPLRESGDIDIVVKPSDATKALKLLIEAGYTLEIDSANNENIINDIVERGQWREVSLSKMTKSGWKTSIDFHWGINETFQQYKFHLEDLFEDSKIDSFQKKQLLIPSQNTIFKQMLNHHGGRNCWLRLKDFCDFIVFMKAYPEQDFASLRILAAEMNMKVVFENGIQILESYFYENKVLSPLKTVKQITNFWEELKGPDMLSYKITLKSIHRSLQDSQISWWKYIMIHIKYYSIPNQVENKRLIVFPDNYVFLNAFSKSISYLFSRINPCDNARRFRYKG